MFSHVFVGVSDFDRALAFYTPLMASLGIEARFCERSRPWAGWQSHPGPRPLFGESDGAPGLRPEYYEHYYGAYFRDPDGNKLCVACHLPPV
jgi:catechol 2,3-dioxygenase-like lactoylglutathione lyase family enzyme